MASLEAKPFDAPDEVRPFKDGMGQVELKMLGIGLPAAVLLDATVVRGILVPAAMTLLGNRCWYLPRWLTWLPGRDPRSLA